MLNQILEYLKNRPALVASAVSILGTALAAGGLHLSPGQLAGVVSMLNILLGALVHQATVPARKAGTHGEHEKAS